MAKGRKYNCIKEVLAEKGKTQAWLAAELGKEFLTVNRYANNARQPSIETLYEIARILKVKPSQLLVE
ncbi:MAG: helix-turn-helix transcriptional regulator [Bacteroidia bacterium]|nr:helix-turn-helix transcriptional regulator [Bacteroidia bacterium]